MLYSVLLVISALAGFYSLIRIPQTFTKIIWAPVVAVVQMGFLALVLAVLYLLQVGYSPLVGIGSNLILTIGTLIVTAKHKTPIASSSKAVTSKRSATAFVNLIHRNHQDIVVLFVVIFIALLCGYLQFGLPPSIAFISGDASYHWSQSLDIAMGSPAEGQYLGHACIAFAMSIFLPFLTTESTWMVFVYCEVVFFILSGMMFYTTLSALTTSLNTFTKCLLVALYILGYPLNNMLYGFSYLGISVTVVCALIFLTAQWNLSTNNLLLQITISLMMFCTMISYPLFAPPVYISLFFFFLTLWHRNKMPLKKAFGVTAYMFLAPFLLGVIMVYFPIFIDTNTTIQGGIIREGAIYRDFFASFIFILPFSLLGLTNALKNNRLDAPNLITILFIISTAVLLVLCITQKASSYYYYKMYFVNWLLAFLYAGIAIQSLKKQVPALLVNYSVTWGIVLFLCLPSVSLYLSKKTSTFTLLPQMILFQFMLLISKISAKTKCHLTYGTFLRKLMNCVSKAAQLLTSQAMSRRDGAMQCTLPHQIRMKKLNFSGGDTMTQIF